MKGVFGKLTGWLNLLLESQCPLCRRSSKQEFCQDCQRQVQYCQLVHPAEFWQAPLPIFAWGSYEGALKRSLVALKYHNQPQLARPLGHWLAQTWLNSPLAGVTPLIVVPIPMHPDKQKQRGFNQAELLARSFCEFSRLPLQPQGLSRIRETEAQFNLSATARAQNLSGAFRLGQAFAHHRPANAILLLDDIYTTGATARAAAQVFHQHDIAVYGVIAVAKPGDRKK